MPRSDRIDTHIVVVNRHRVAKNRKNGTNMPVLRVSRGRYGKPEYANCVDYSGSVRVVYDPLNPLPCGATAWIELN